MYVKRHLELVLISISNVGKVWGIGLESWNVLGGLATAAQIYNITTKYVIISHLTGGVCAIESRNRDA